MNPNIESIAISEFLAKELDTSLKHVLKRISQCRENFGEDAIHDLRVSIRRMLTDLFLIENLIQSPYIQDLKSVLKKILKSFNDLRDIHVQILCMEEVIGEFPVLKKFLSHLEQINDELSGILKEKISFFPVSDVRGLILFLKLDVKTKDSIKVIKINNIAEILLKSFKMFRFMHLQSNPSSPRSFHPVRIALKRLRYLSESLQKLFGIDLELIKIVKNLQTILGNLQDVCVLRAKLEKYVLKYDNGNFLTYKQIFMNLQNKQESLIGDYYGKSLQILNLVNYPFS